ncbi:Callose synthase [Arachis hypogaea]|nr:Callose synthase [Arachis hypogaea]
MKRRRVCKHAYSLSQNLEPISEGLGVLQFKTGLISVIKVLGLIVVVALCLVTTLRLLIVAGDRSSRFRGWSSLSSPCLTINFLHATKCWSPICSQFPLQTESAATSYLRVPSPNSSSSLHSLRRPRLPASNLRPPSSRPRHCPFQPAQTASSPHRPVRPVPFSLFPSFAALLVTSVSDIFSHFSLIPERIFRHMAKRWKKRRKKEGKVGMAMAMAVVVMVMEAVMVIVEEESGGRVWKWSR